MTRSAGSSTGQVIARYARFRLAFSGLWHFLFGLVFLAVAFVPLFMVWITNRPGTPLTQATPWPLAFVGLFPLLLSWLALPVGVNRLRAAFERDCYFRVGSEGVELRIPLENQGWRRAFRYHVGRFVLPLDYFADVVRHTSTVNGIPTGSKLRLTFRDKTRLTIDRCYFRESTRKIQDRLLAMLRAPG